MPDCSKVTKFFEIKRFSLSTKQRRQFFLLPLCKKLNGIGFLILRVIMCCLLVGWTIFTGIWEAIHYNWSGLYWFTHAINLSLLLLCVDNIVWMIVIIVTTCGKKCSNSILSFLWFIHTIAVNAVVTSCVFHWILLPSDQSKVARPLLVYFIYFIPLTLVKIDHFFIHIPVELAHFVYVLLSGIVYLIMRLIYKAVIENQNIVEPEFMYRIYTDMKWSFSTGDNIAGCLVILLIILATHVAFYLLYVIRKFCISLSNPKDEITIAPINNNNNNDTPSTKPTIFNNFKHKNNNSDLTEMSPLNPID